MARLVDGSEQTAEGKVTALRKVICENLNRFVAAKRVTKSELARALGVSPRAVAKWLSGESGIDVDHIKPVCDYLGVPVVALLGEGFANDELPAEGRMASDLFWSLDATGRAKVVEYMGDLAATGKYSGRGR